MPPESNDAVLRLLVDLIRDQAKVLAECSTAVAVGTDRQGRMLEAVTGMTEMLARLDKYLAGQETANASARAQAALGQAAEQKALTKLYNTVQRGLASSTGQRVVQTLTLAALAWAGVHFGIVVPGPGVTP